MINLDRYVSVRNYQCLNYKVYRNYYSSLRLSRLVSIDKILDFVFRRNPQICPFKKFVAYFRDGRVARVLTTTRIDENAGGILSLITAVSSAKYVSLAWGKKFNTALVRGEFHCETRRRRRKKVTGKSRDQVHERAISSPHVSFDSFLFPTLFHRELHAPANLHNNSLEPELEIIIM